MGAVSRSVPAALPFQSGTQHQARHERDTASSGRGDRAKKPGNHKALREIGTNAVSHRSPRLVHQGCGVDSQCVPSSALI